MSTTRSHALLGELDRLEALRDSSRQGLRNFGRYVIRGDAELHQMNRNRLDPTPIEIKIRDISRGGMGFICSQPLAEHSSWRACFLQHGYVVGMQALVIRHCREVGEGTYLVGGQFVIDSGLMVTLGVPRGALQDDEVMNPNDEPNNETFLSPREIEE